jgi:hypothetical protein
VKFLINLTYTSDLHEIIILNEEVEAKEEMIPLAFLSINTCKYLMCPLKLMYNNSLARLCGGVGGVIKGSRWSNDEHSEFSLLFTSLYILLLKN